MLVTRGGFVALSIWQHKHAHVVRCKQTAGLHIVAVWPPYLVSPVQDKGEGGAAARGVELLDTPEGSWHPRGHGSFELQVQVGLGRDELGIVQAMLCNLHVGVEDAV